MLTCDHCGAAFPVEVVIRGKVRILSRRRRYCLQCVPFGRIGKPPAHLRRRVRTCLACGAETPNAQFCSTKCQQVLKWQEAKARIDATGVIPAGPSGQCRLVKRYLLETRGHVCAICSLTEWCGQPIPLVLDHIDGNADNWAVSNLRLICGNCDMLLPTYKSKNRGHGRAWRRARYAAGKSY